MGRCRDAGRGCAVVILAAIVMSLCPPEGLRQNCVTDGDTFWLGREKVRIAYIDAPEMKARCAGELTLAIRSRDRLLELLQRPFIVHKMGTDRYGRTLAEVHADGRDIGQVLIREGLARPYAGGRKSWC